MNPALCLRPALAVCAFGLVALASRLPAQGTPPAAATDNAPPVFSESFESGKLDPAVWDTRTNNGAVVKVQSDIVHGGKYALQVHYPAASGAWGFIVAPHLPDSVRTHFFGRAYMYITPGMPAGHDPLLSAGGAGWPISNFLEIAASGGKRVMTSYQQNAANIDRNETITNGPAYPVGKWFCLEWEFNDKPDSINVWIDGVASGELKNFVVKPRGPAAPRRGAAGAAPTPAPAAATPPPAPKPAIKGDGLVKGFVDFAFGFRAWGKAPTAEYDLYYDDIVIDTKRIGPAK
jgi:hypothetical protein